MAKRDVEENDDLKLEKETRMVNIIHVNVAFLLCTVYRKGKGYLGKPRYFSPQNPHC